MSASILYLDEIGEMRDLVTEVLEENGYQARGAGSSREALRLVEKLDFQVVLCELKMAQGRDGSSVLSQLRKRRPELRCL